jgi:hypothetical protein
MKNLILILLFSLSVNAQTYIQSNSLIEVPKVVATAAGTTTLVAADETKIQFTGVTTQTVVLPNATTLKNGRRFFIFNNSTGTLTVNYNGGSLALSMVGLTRAEFYLISNGSSDGTWSIYGANSVDVTIASGNGLTVSGQALSLALSSTSTTGSLSSTDWNTFNGKQAALTFGNFTDAGTDGITVTSGTGAVIGSGTSLAQRVADTTHNGYLSSTDWNTFNGKQASGNYITALTGDVTATASSPGSAVTTLATVNSNVGTFGSSTSIPTVTVNGKGLVTAASGNAVIAPAGTLTGTTLAANVVTSSLTSVGTITSGAWTGTSIAIANGGTGQTSKASAFDALQPMTTGGDIIYGGASGTGTRLAAGSAGQFLQSNGTSAPTWVSNPIAYLGCYYINPAQTFNNNSETVVKFNTGKVGDPNSFLNTTTGVVTPTIAGTYELSACMGGPLSATGQQDIYAFKNGSEYWLGGGASNTTYGTSVCISGALVNVNGSTDNFSIAYLQSSGGTFTTGTGSTANFFCFQRVGN